jgi:catechol 2,3-dioxygenase-like lactoylglutathione lyase family enzyme
MNAERAGAAAPCTHVACCLARTVMQGERIMQHQGRLLDHVHLRVADLEASKRFYKAVLGALDLLGGYGERPGNFFADELYVDRADGPVSRVHLAFQARGEEQVQRFHAAALAAGGVDNGAPGLRHYGARYYAAFALDPDGNNIEAVWHGPTRRSATSVTIES